MSTRLISTSGTRAVATARAVLAAFLCASSLANNSPLGVLDASDLILLPYTCYAILLVLAFRYRALVFLVQPRAVLLTAIDLIVFTALLYMTGGADSPFFSPFIFLVLAAGLQWGSRGALYMGLLVSGLFMPSGVIAFAGSSSADTGSHFILRAGYLPVMAFLLWTFARHVERIFEELSRLSVPIGDFADSPEPPLEAALDQALGVFAARRGVLLWLDGEEPHGTLLIASGDAARARHTLSDLPPGLFEPETAASAYLCDRDGRTIARAGSTITAVTPPPFLPVLNGCADYSHALLLRTEQQDSVAWLAILDHTDPANENLAIGTMVAAQLSMFIERWRSHQTRREIVASEERLRLARDLHDGVLQFMAGAGLQLDSIARRGGLAPEDRERLRLLKGSLSEEQRELRALITNLRPSHGAARPAPLRDELGALAERLARSWEIGIDVDVQPQTLQVDQSMAFDLSRIVREAVANAVRHGKATAVCVQARAEDDALLVSIEDNGQGFPAPICWTDEDMDTNGSGPRSLRERAASLSGRLRIESGRDGTKVLVTLPAGVRR
ncbi:putative two-component histidine kinase [Sphingomonas changbaiensis NBRC 104936]|uniref:Putative two-component histidine kinase n=1 Tax=Sphingomonas changbaiensis NBRC 104936 TaxID=1219043 RepID=A0A0E9MP70_9SPHN|nr:sensor histidine kinase [Sphingomonas changbaiensis]GAO39231.1 putative two-component histidine kinase [Sphingomonas changbaiensis NBRC 104936]